MNDTAFCPFIETTLEPEVKLAKGSPGVQVKIENGTRGNCGHTLHKDLRKCHTIFRDGNEVDISLVVDSPICAKALEKMTFVCRAHQCC
jgi:hypothetical protein